MAEKFEKKPFEFSSTVETHSSSLDKNRSKKTKFRRTLPPAPKNRRYPGTFDFVFLSQSFNNKSQSKTTHLCEIVLEEDIEPLEEQTKKRSKITPILDKKEELLFGNNRSSILNYQDRSRSTDLTLPKVIESKEEDTPFHEKPKYKFSNYLALIDKTDRLNLFSPKKSFDSKDMHFYESQDAIKEDTLNEEEPFVDDNISDNRSNSIKSGSISRISNSSFIKKRVIDECFVFDKEKELSGIVL